MRPRHTIAWLMTALLTAIGGANGCGGTAETSAPNDAVAPCTPRSSERRGGFEDCAEGYEHRERAEACGPPLTQLVRPPGTCDPSLFVPSDTNTCLTDSECTERPSGRCDYAAGTPAGPGGCFCRYPCANDADCGSGFVCSCGRLPGADTGLCIPATCTTDADCDGNLCAKTEIACPGFFACFSAGDTCRAFEDCTADETCQLDARTGARSCIPLSRDCLGG